MKQTTVIAFFLYITVLTTWQRMVSAKQDGKPCKSDADCPADQCCVSMGFWRKAKTHCAPLLKEGETCIPDEGDFKSVNGNYFQACPCKSGLECTAGYYREIPFMGKVAFNETCTTPTIISISTASATTAKPATSSTTSSKASSTEETSNSNN